MNRGLKLLFCKECGRKRFCKSISIPNYNFKKICSKGHEWIVAGFTLERMDAAIKDTFDSNKLKNLFERDDTFFRELKR